MIATDFDDTNHTFAAPPEMDQDVQQLPVMVGKQPLPSGKNALALVSRWTPTPDEREAIANGDDIYLHVLAKNQPPVLLATEPKADPIDVDHQPPPGSTTNGKDPDA